MLHEDHRGSNGVFVDDLPVDSRAGDNEKQNGGGLQSSSENVRQASPTLVDPLSYSEQNNISVRSHSTKKR